MAEPGAAAGYERERLRAVQDRLRSPEDYVRYQMLGAEALLRRMRPFLPSGNLSILEVGCGTGGISLYLASQGFKVSAVDRQQYDSQALDAARGVARTLGIALDIYLADASALPFDADTFDCVVCSNVVEHLDDPHGAMAEMHRVLLPGGLAFIDFPLFHSMYGGHIDDVIKTPWFHLLPKAYVESTLRRRGAERDRAVFATLSGITNRRFRRIVTALGFEIAWVGRSHYLTHPGRKLVLSLLSAVRCRSPRAAWQSMRDAAREFSGVELLQLPLLSAAVPLSYVPGIGELFASGVKYVLRKRSGPVIPAGSVTQARQMPLADGRLMGWRNPASTTTLRDRLRAFALQRPTGRLLLLPVRVMGALRHYAPALGGIASWAVRSREYSNFTYEYTDRNRVFLEHLLARVTGLEPIAVRGYLDEPAADRELQESLATCRARSRFRAVTDADVRLGRQLIWYALTRALRPKRVVEAGVGFGLSAALIGQALLRNGRDGAPGTYVGIDRDPNAGFLVGPEQRQVVTILHGDSVATLGGLEGPIDLFISDSHVSADLEYAECRAIESRLNPTAVVATTVSASLPRFADETGREFLAFKEEPRGHWYPGAWIGFAFRASSAR